ncbi:MAG TPA: lipid-A-disaccharide synthase [Candidatus Binatia bacterium]|nr:lipid-A-disaccharide synthase [Candidatus Binatia bacterium]
MADPSKQVMLVVGEASGDMHGAHLVKALSNKDQTLRFFGVAGEQLTQTNFEPLFNVSQIARMGFVELAGSLGNIWHAYRTLARALRERKPDLLVLIDFPEFNMRLAKLAKKLAIPVLYYIGPQIWAWRRGRVRQIARYVDHMAVVFPFEARWYASRGVKVSFVGHPLLDIVRSRKPREAVLAQFGLNAGKRTIAILPGSRRGEVAYHLPVLLDTAQRLSQDLTLQFLVIRASTVDRREVESLLERVPLKIPIVEDQRYEALNACDLAWTASGTATVETALLLKPMIIVYRLSWLTYALARMLVKLHQVGMVNIIAGKTVVPELIQSNLTAAKLAKETRNLLENSELRERIVQKLVTVRTKLGAPGAADRVARIALSMLEKGSGMAVKESS